MEPAPSEIGRDPLAPPSDDRATARQSVLTLRVLLLAPLLIVLNAWWIVEIEYIRYSDNCTTQSLFFNAISLLLLLLAANSLLKRIRPAWVFTSAEMVGLYVIVVAAS